MANYLYRDGYFPKWKVYPQKFKGSGWIHEPFTRPSLPSFLIEKYARNNREENSWKGKLLASAEFLKGK